MKTMTCKQLGGACDLEFQADTFEEMAALSQKHGMEMYKANDGPHLKAMKKIQELMSTPGAMDKWQESKRAEFDQLPDVE